MHYDVIVLGLGGIGSAALYHLARRGLKVVGVEQFDIGHALGSSHGETRLIRHAYFEHADYTPLLYRAYELWRETQAASGERLFEDGTGLVVAGPPDAHEVSATLATAEKYHLPMQTMSDDEFAQRCPDMRLPPGFQAIWDGAGGVLWVERCVQAHVRLARQAGAEVMSGTPLSAWRATDASVEVDTPAGKLTADRLVICAGPWSSQVLNDLGMPLEVRRKVLFWHRPKQAGAYALGRFPAFLFAMGYGTIYGFPAVNERGVKIADHHGGQSLSGPLPAREVLGGDHETVERAVDDLFPLLERDYSEFAVCMYTMTPDENFVLDVHPAHPNVCFGAGFSGHGFKFAPVIGEVLADLATRGATDHPIEFLRLARPTLKA
jgi:sarcosine oxidase